MDIKQSNFDSVVMLVSLAKCCINCFPWITFHNQSPTKQTWQPTTFISTLVHLFFHGNWFNNITQWSCDWLSVHFHWPNFISSLLQHFHFTPPSTSPDQSSPPPVFSICLIWFSKEFKLIFVFQLKNGVISMWHILHWCPFEIPADGQ